MQEEQQDCSHDQHCQDQVSHDGVQRGFCVFRVIVDDLQDHPFREKGLQLFHRLANVLRGLDSIGIGLLGDTQGDRVFTV